MTQLFIAVFGTALALGAMAILGLAWAIRTGQFEDFRAGATSIFDEDESIGEMTDAFPGEGSKRSTGGSSWHQP